MANRVSTVFEFDQKGSGLSGIRRDVQATEGSFKKLKTASKGVVDEIKNSRVAQGALIAGATTFAKASIDAAVDLEESINAVKVTFGDAADEILTLSDNSATAVGLASADFNGLAVQFAAFAEKIAGPGGDVAGVIGDLTTRAADFASVMNLEVADAAAIFQSTLAGESEPIRRFGGDVSAAAVELYALENGLADSKDEITESVKVAARYELLMEQTAKTAGDFANTSDSLANQQRILRAQLTDTTATIGQELTPAVADIAGVLNDAASAFNDFNSAAEGATGRSAVGISFDVGLAPLKALNDYNNAILGFVGIGGDAEEVASSLWVDAAVDGAIISAQDGYNESLERGVMIAEGADQALLNMSDRLGVGAAIARDADRALVGFADSNTSAAEAAEMAAEAAEAQRQAIEDLFDEVDKNLDTMFDYENATLDLVNSVGDYIDREEELQRQLGNNEITLEDYATELRNLRIDQNNLADSALTAAEIYAEQQGAVEGSTESYRLQKEELLRLADQFPLLRDEITRYIEELNRIPDVIGTQIVLSRSGSSVLRSSGSSLSFGDVDTTGLQALDSGGIVEGPKGSPQLIVAHGGETVLPTHKGMPSMPMGIGGGVSISIGQIVTAAPDGQRLLDDLTAAIRRQGPSGIRRAIGV